MSISDFFLLAEDCPDNLPSREDIVAMCTVAGPDCRGIPFRSNPSEPITAWIKYGVSVCMAEALTQDMVAKVINTNPESTVRVPRVYQAFKEARTCNLGSYSIGYIVMEYIDAPDCDEKDFKLVANAVQMLISVKGPSSVPGFVGNGGFVVHRFFFDWTAPIRYESVEELEQHVNGILEFKRDPRRINLVEDARDGLYLCPSDINPGNFKKCHDGTVVALDFGATCFLPPCFFAVAVAKGDDIFTMRVAKRITYPQSPDVAVMVAASYFLVPYCTDRIGIPNNLLHRLEH